MGVGPERPISCNCPQQRGSAMGVSKDWLLLDELLGVVWLNGSSHWSNTTPLSAVPGCRVLCILWIPPPPSSCLLSFCALLLFRSQNFFFFTVWSQVAQVPDCKLGATQKGLKAPRVCPHHSCPCRGARVQTVQEHAWLFLNKASTVTPSERIRRACERGSVQSWTPRSLV